ncbi:MULTISPECIES: hypothetical protein [unclassified Nocardioides]|uniref:hypothetical protein n=1 Tax=unclassified Nocardioides TaxID=2615069 RepID=UPI0006F3E4A1|nr:MULTISPECIES: hypothetical protein [unclassified Nocardioides]KRA37762.1 hypothetical protein ASD81_03435 [Nocardioides sp. Root614]KRA91722.1 hypothetical protein ASD84_03700 [Nocardioides sp. Root682]
MACCAVLALVLGVLRAIWFHLFPGRRPAEPGFAPPARRSTDGAVIAVPERAPAPPRGTTSGLLLGVVIGTVAYALVVAAIGTTPLVRTFDGPWLWRDAALVALASAALLGVFARNTPTPRPALLVAAGITWTELGLVDMHLLGLFDFRVAALPLDLLFHGSGLLVVALGARSLARTPDRPIPRPA